MTAPDRDRPGPGQLRALHAELDSVRRRLAEVTPTPNPTAGIGPLIAGAAGLGVALVSVLIGSAVAATADSTPARVIAGAAAVLLGFGFGFLGIRRVRAWLGRSAALQRERDELLARHGRLLAALGQRPAGPQPGPAVGVTRRLEPDRFRRVVGSIVAALIVLSVITTIVIQNL